MPDARAVLIRERRDAAEEVMFTLMLMMALGMFELPMESRQWLAEKMQIWVDKAVETGMIADDVGEYRREDALPEVWQRG